MKVPAKVKVFPSQIGGPVALYVFKEIFFENGFDYWWTNLSKINRKEITKGEVNATMLFAKVSTFLNLLQNFNYFIS